MPTPDRESTWRLTAAVNSQQPEQHAAFGTA